MIIAGFEDGVIRVLHIVKNQGADAYGRVASDMKAVMVLAQALKPHSSRVTCFAVDIYCKLLATGVSVHAVII